MNAVRNRAGRSGWLVKYRVALLGGVLALLLGTAAGLWYWNGRPEVAAEAFLGQLGQGQVGLAFLSTAPSFRSTTNGQMFSKLVRRTGLDHLVSWSWTRRQVQDGAASLWGEFHVSNGKVLPILVQLGKDGQGWHVLGFQVTGTAAPPDLPSPAETLQLVGLVMRDFAAAVQARNFSGFWQTLATSWRREVTPADFAASFKDFFDNRLDMTRVLDVAPVLDGRPTLDRDEALGVTGIYPTTPSRVRFAMRFVDENSSWRLVGLTVRVQPLLPAGVAPPVAQHRRRHR